MAELAKANLFSKDPECPVKMVVLNQARSSLTGGYGYGYGYGYGQGYGYGKKPG